MITTSHNQPVWLPIKSFQSKAIRSYASIPRRSYMLGRCTYKGIYLPLVYLHKQNTVEWELALPISTYELLEGGPVLHALFSRTGFSGFSPQRLSYCFKTGYYQNPFCAALTPENQPFAGGTIHKGTGPYLMKSRIENFEIFARKNLTESKSKGTSSSA